MSEEIYKTFDVFNVLNFLNNGYDLNIIFDEIQFESFQSSGDCKDYLINEDYLVANGEPLTEDEISKKYTVNDLKAILKEAGLKVSGKKDELIERVMPVLNEGDDSDAFELTKKAKDFLDENQWIDLYTFALVAFNFEDFSKYYKNSDNDLIQTALNFTDECITAALLRNQFLIFIDALSAKAHVYAYAGDYESFLDYDLQRYILGLNPILLDSRTYATYECINHANIINLSNVLAEFDFGSLKKRFNQIWNKSNIINITVPKKIAFKTLKKALAGEDLDELNFDLREKYFDKKFAL